jgi:cbb3-type cytochrome oxidase subunit 3
VKLSDIMGAANLAVYAEIALAIFFGVFIAIVFYVLRRKNRVKWEQARFMPLDDEHPQELRGAKRDEPETPLSSKAEGPTSG